ncbi:MAG: hypothetical protein OEX97_08055 [Acidimicrobiia bacterium]|nr:hypothetical protein [Acidimicrobiia bacterium]MDH5503475.1 hypothetical protein [Acidimicrobiia bacterium]
MNPWEDPRVAAGLEQQIELRSSALRSGSRSVGWKVGFGAPASLELMQITAPLMGFLTDATVFGSGESVDSTGYQRGVVEFEVAVYLAHDLGPGASDDEASAAIGAVGASIEVANISLPVGPDQVGGIVAGNIFHTAVVFGEPDLSRAGLDISGLFARIFVDGAEVGATGELEAITGRYPTVVRTVADTLAANGLVLGASDVIITGSVIPPIPAVAGSEYTFALDPLDPISVRIV